MQMGHQLGAIAGFLAQRSEGGCDGEQVVLEADVADSAQNQKIAGCGVAC